MRSDHARQGNANAKQKGASRWTILCSLFEVRQLISPSQVNLNLYNFMAILYKFRPKLCFCQLDLASKLEMLVSSR